MVSRISWLQMRRASTVHLEKLRVKLVRWELQGGYVGLPQFGQFEIRVPQLSE